MPLRANRPPSVIASRRATSTTSSPRSSNSTWSPGCRLALSRNGFGITTWPFAPIRPVIPSKYNRVARSTGAVGSSGSARSHDPQEQCRDLTVGPRIDRAPALLESRSVKRTHLVDGCEARRAHTALRRGDSYMQRGSAVARRERDAEAQSPPGRVERVARDHDDRPRAGLLATGGRIQSREPHVAPSRLGHSSAMGAARSERSHSLSSASISRSRSGCSDFNVS